MNYDPRFEETNGDAKLPYRKITRLISRNPTSSDQAAVGQWDAVTLRDLLSSSMAGDQIIVVSNRQPFTLDRVNGDVTMTQPASGLVTALEPVVRACNGTWIAHGSGNSDRDFVDAADRCPAPATDGAYTLRRVWLSPEEQRGYCDGFSNSGLWPLCHMVHVRPVFRESDWQQYRAVNARFADAVVREARGPNPIVLVQDYHLALVPALVRAQLPHATIVSFWHIPWTHPDQMGVCPWLSDLLEGMLGSDIVGFQTPQHQRNFVDLAQRSGKVVRQAVVPEIVQRSHSTQVRDYPISIAWPKALEVATLPTAEAGSRDARPTWSLGSQSKLIVGVDRFDYTKGIIERMHAFEQLLDTQPQWQGKVRLVQIAAPTRTGLKEYTDFQNQVFSEVARINAKFASSGDAPIVLLDAHHDRLAVDALYRAADVCLVTSLHDGMNLVCKEFVAARDDEQGVLVLSQFAGAANELGRALIVNPYHTVQVAAAIHQALCMPPEEQRQRMCALRSTVKRANVYRWAASMLLDAAAIRAPAQDISTHALPFMQKVAPLRQVIRMQCRVANA